MRITITDKWKSRANVDNSNPQLWGIISFRRQTDDMRNSLVAELHGRSDIKWAAGHNWCFVCERGEVNGNSLASCSESALHVAVAGNAWPLNGERTKDAQLVADVYRLYQDDIINHCDGQFAAVVINEKDSRAVLTVNWPGGFHWLYYCTDGHSLAFATHLNLLIHRCGWQATVNEQALVDLLRFGGLANGVSLLEGVHRVVPGFAVVFEERGVARRPVYEYPLHEDHDPSDTTVKGKTTFADLKSWGLSTEEIETAIGMEAGKSGVTVRDHVVSAGREFGSAKAALQELVDSKN